MKSIDFTVLFNATKQNHNSQVLNLLLRFPTKTRVTREIPSDTRLQETIGKTIGGSVPDISSSMEVPEDILVCTVYLTRNWLPNRNPFFQLLGT